MFEQANAYQHFKARERDLIHQAQQERLAQEIEPTNTKSNRTLSQMGHLLVKVGTHLVEAYSETKLSIPTMPNPATGNQA